MNGLEELPRSLIHDLPPAQVTSKRSANRTERWISVAKDWLTEAVQVSSPKDAWGGSALEFIVQLIDAGRRDLAATLIVKVALRADPHADGRTALSALLTSRWPEGLDVVGFFDEDVWPERVRALLARQAATEVRAARDAERRRRVADRTAREAARVAELETRLADETARQEANRRRYPRHVAR